MTPTQNPTQKMASTDLDCYLRDKQPSTTEKVSTSEAQAPESHHPEAKEPPREYFCRTTFELLRLRDPERQVADPRDCCGDQLSGNIVAQQLAVLHEQLQKQSRKLEEHSIKIKGFQEQFQRETESLCHQVKQEGKAAEQRLQQQSRIQRLEEQVQIKDVQEQVQRETENLHYQLNVQENAAKEQIQQQAWRLEEQFQKIKELRVQAKDIKKQLHSQLESGLTALRDQIQKQDETLEEKFQEIKILQAQRKDIEKQLQKQLETGLSDLQGEVQKQNEKVAEQLQELKNLQAQEKDAEKQLQKQLEAHLNGLEDQIRKQDKKATADLQEQTQQQMKFITEVQGQLERKLTEQRKETQQETFEMQAQLQKEIKLLKNALPQLGIEMQSLLQEDQAIVPAFFEFTLTQFSVYRAKGGRGTWHSDPFYSHPRGYKFHLSIDTNGYWEAQGTHLSADIYQLAGENDDDLSWPIQVTVLLKLLNQTGNHGHVVASYNARFKKNDSMPFTEIARKFIAHSELGYNAAKATHYLKNDGLQFRLYLKVTPA